MAPTSFHAAIAQRAGCLLVALSRAATKLTLAQLHCSLSAQRGCCGCLKISCIVAAFSGGAQSYSYQCTMNKGAQFHVGALREARAWPEPDSELELGPISARAWPELGPSPSLTQ